MILIGERINGSIPSVAKLIAGRKEEEIRELARRQAEAGADFIDICAPAECGEEETLHWLIDVVQNAADVPISIDSPSAKVLQSVWRYCKRPGIFNSVSMESGKRIDEIFRIMAEQPGWQVIAMLCGDERISHSFTLKRRLGILDEIMRKAENLRIEPPVRTAGGREARNSRILRAGPPYSKQVSAGAYNLGDQQYFLRTSCQALRELRLRSAGNGGGTQQRNS